MALMVKARWIRQINSARFHRLGRELIWISLGQGLATLGALVGVRLLTSVLNPTIYGQLALAMTLALLVNQMLLGPLSGAALRFYAPAHEAKMSFRYSWQRYADFWPGQRGWCCWLVALYQPLCC